jgi:adenosylmethionine-8-amino-7-oxononanoate aminotransferase
VSAPSTSSSIEDLQRAARDHLWLHFTEMGKHDPPIIVRGEGCYLEDAHGNRYLDALAGLFAVQVGYSYGEEMGQAALEQMRELPFYTNWSYAHPRAIELAQEVASLAPGDLNRCFFVSGGSEAVESAWKLARQYHQARGERRWKAVARRTAYHGTTMGALSINGIPALRAPFEPLVPDTIHVRNTNRYHRPPDETEEEFTAYLLEDLESSIEQAGPETVAMVIMEPVQNAGGAFTPPAGYWQGVRAICDRYGILLCADEVITGFGRLGDWFGSTTYDIRPDLITSAKGLSSAYASIGAVIAADHVVEPFLGGGAARESGAGAPGARGPAAAEGRAAMYTHGITFGGHPVQCAIALKNIEIMKRERVVENVAENGAAFRATLEQLLDLPIVGDVRGTGFFYAIEPSTTPSARRCYAASSRRSSSRRASSAVPTIAETLSSRSRRRSSRRRRSSTR